MDLILIDFKYLFFLYLSEEELLLNSYWSNVSSGLSISSELMSFSKWVLKSSARNETILSGLLVLCHEFSSSSESQNLCSRLKFIFSRAWLIFIAASFIVSCDRSILTMSFISSFDEKTNCHWFLRWKSQNWIDFPNSSARYCLIYLLLISTPSSSHILRISLKERS